MSFFQDGPVLSNLYAQDSFLKTQIERGLPASLAKDHEKHLQELGKDSATLFSALQDQSDKNPPQIKHFDAWGRRIDEIEEAKHWGYFREMALKWNIVGRGHDQSLGPHARVLQTAYMMLFSPTTANYLCPLAMSDAAACVLKKIAPLSMRGRLYDKLISQDPGVAITSGQWMTERPGGSDVSRSETVAVFERSVGEEPRYRLSGVKWFTSSITSEMSLLLAQAEGAERDKALTLFCWERPQKPTLSCEQGVRVLRLKDKLGTRALPTAEIELDKAPAIRLGEIGRGVSHISEMLNITRFYNAVASASLMNYASLLVGDYAQRRRAFGNAIGEHALMASVIKDLRRNSEGATALCFEVARLIGLAECGLATTEEKLCLRAAVPLAKLLLGKAAVAHASETLECFGGAGYIEDTGLPRLLRDAQVLPIWEGTTNVLALDLWRSERKEGSVSALLEAMLLRKSAHDEVKHLQTRLKALHVSASADAPAELRSFVFDLGELLLRQLHSY